MPDFSFEGLILKPLLSWIIGILNSVYKFLLQATEGFFDIDVIRQVLTFFQWLSWCIFVFGIIFALIDYAIDFIDGNNPSVFTLFKNIGKGLVVTMLSQKLVLLIFDIARAATLSLFKLNQDSGLNSDLIGKILGKDPASVILMAILIFIFFIILIVMIFFQYLERNGILLLQIVLVNFYIISICRGFHDPFSMWIRQSISICFTQTMQTLCVITAFFLFANPATFFLGVGMLIAASKVDKVMQQFAFSSGSRNTAKTAVNASMTAFRVMALKK